MRIFFPILKLPVCISLLLTFHSFESRSQNIKLRIVSPTSKHQEVRQARQFITGTTCIECSVSVNGEAVKVYKTGAFAFETKLNSGENVFSVTTSLGNKAVSEKITFKLLPPVVPKPLAKPGIETIKVFPEGDLQLIAGDKISFEVKAFPNSFVTAMGKVLHEMPSHGDSSKMGIYKGSYVIQQSDSFSFKSVPVKLIATSGDSVSKNSTSSLSVLSPLASTVVRTKGRLAHLEFGLGDDRLGGAKIGYLDSLIPLEVTGKIGKDYRIKLAPGRTAYIEDDLVDLMPVGLSLQPALTGKWMVSGDDRADYVKVALERRLPYQSMQTLHPAGILVDVFGAVNNTNWITQLQTVKEIESVDYEQVADEVFRIKIGLKNRQHWGHSIYYEGNQLVIRVRHQPKSLQLKDLVVAVDAGHGGRNTGAVGITGSIEKNIALAISLQLQNELQKEGAKVIMTRTREQFYDNKERILFYRDSVPDLLISVHLNASSDPVNVGGTSTFYRYPGNKNLSAAVHKRMLELGLKDYGVNGSFNFMLNSPTEYPNVLAETLFLSNPAEEELALDPAFQQKMAQKIVAGVKDFLEAASKKR